MQLMTDNSTKTLINLTKQIYNGLTQAIEDGDTKESQERIKQDDIISAKVTTEAEARIQADSDEATTRQQKDAELQKAIDTEASNLEAAEKTLTDNLTAEATARAEADTAINTKLDPLIQIAKRLDVNYANTGKLTDNWGLVNFGHVNQDEITTKDPTLTNQQTLKEMAVKACEKVLAQSNGNKAWTYIHFIGVFYGSFPIEVIGFLGNYTDTDGVSKCPNTVGFLGFGRDDRKKLYHFGYKSNTWYYREFSCDDDINTLISNAKKSLETAYKNADTQLQTDITAAYQQADANLSNALTTAYTDADTALKTELEGKINNATNPNAFIKKYEIASVSTATLSMIYIDKSGQITSSFTTFSGPGTSQNGWYAYLLRDGDKIIDGWLCNTDVATKNIWKLYHNAYTITSTKKDLVFVNEPAQHSTNGLIFYTGYSDTPNVVLGQEL